MVHCGNGSQNLPAAQEMRLGISASNPGVLGVKGMQAYPTTSEQLYQSNNRYPVNPNDNLIDGRTRIIPDGMQRPKRSIW